MGRREKSVPMQAALSENTMKEASNGFKRFNILGNHKDGVAEMRRKSIVLDNEYSSGDGTVPSSDDNPVEVPAPKAAGTETSPDRSGPGSDESVYDHVKSSKVSFQKNGKMRSNFADLNFQPRATIIDSEIHYGTNFFGFFVAGWICVFFSGLNELCGYHYTHGSLFRSDIMGLMLKDLWKVALTDLAMYLSLYSAVVIQLLVKHRLINWKHTGYTIQVFYEILLLCLPLKFAEWMDYPWIAQIFIMLHSVVMLMKVHSYAFFNGYLWEIVNELEFSSLFIKKFENLDNAIKVALDNSVNFCQSEIKSQDFPSNITFKNFFEYSMFPVLVYQSKYPRNDRIRKGYLFKKIAGIFGIILLMITIAQYRLYPIVIHCLELQATETFWFRLKSYPFILIETIPPFLFVYLLVFYLIWELILNAIAELSCFADREFYRYWWNSVDWNEYARDWNVPVHKFLLRHVYHSSISAFKVNKTLATFLTFFLSSIIHELAMYVIFKKIRFYLLMLQMSQLSLVQLSRTKWMRDKYVLGNCIFWFGIVFGPSLMCTMYLVF